MLRRLAPNNANHYAPFKYPKKAAKAA
jgi:hypothetical protein